MLRIDNAVLSRATKSPDDTTAGVVDGLGGAIWLHLTARGPSTSVIAPSPPTVLERRQMAATGYGGTGYGGADW
jgi:hypothetical protein